VRFNVVAAQLKRDFERHRGGINWQAIVGKSFGSFVTHEDGTFIFLTVKSLSVLVWNSNFVPDPKA